jgi:hypothetical protein
MSWRPVEKTCSRCRGPRENPAQRYCRPCHAANMRDWRKVNPMNDGQRKRDIARSTANMALKRGQIKQEPCRVCGSSDSQMHHPDHELPKLVVWLCRDMVDCEVGLIAPDYASAHAIWRQYHTLAAPYLISPLGRVIDPATPIIDVNE